MIFDWSQTHTPTYLGFGYTWTEAVVAAAAVTAPIDLCFEAVEVAHPFVDAVQGQMLLDAVPDVVHPLIDKVQVTCGS